MHNSPGTQIRAEMVSVVARKLRKERREQTEEKNLFWKCRFYFVCSS